MNFFSSMVPCGLSCTRYRNPLTLGHASPATSLTRAMYLSSTSAPLGIGAHGTIARQSFPSSGSAPSPSSGFPRAIRASLATSSSGFSHPEPSASPNARSTLGWHSTAMKPSREGEERAAALNCWMVWGPSKPVSGFHHESLWASSSRHRWMWESMMGRMSGCWSSDAIIVCFSLEGGGLVLVPGWR